MEEAFNISDRVSVDSHVPGKASAIVALACALRSEQVKVKRLERIERAANRFAKEPRFGRNHRLLDELHAALESP